ncbi:unannotated protein [freshwater metagenome]|uniref:Unannotated protein n=1 Tax=freshwater metagenome TaxID=449393 RepID=A0A6J6VEY8_9ZZZZ
MLLREQSRGNDDSNLLSILDRFECCAHRNFGLAVAHITTYQSIHGDGAFHVRFHLINRGKLVDRLVVGEGVFEFALPGRIGTKGETWRCHPCRIQSNQPSGDLFDRLTGSALGLDPVRSTHARQCGSFTTRIPSHLIELVSGDKQTIRRSTTLAGRILHDEVLTHRTLNFSAHHLDIATYAVLFMNNKVTWSQCQGVNATASTRGHALHVLGCHSLARNIGLSNHHQLGTRGQKASLKIGRCHGDQIRLRGSI